VTLSRRAIAYAEENRTAVFIATGALIVLLVALLAYRAARSSREAGAAEAYRQARTLLDDRKYTDAATAFRQAAETYPSTRHGVLAKLQNANSLLLAERPGEAALGYQKFLDSSPPTDDLRQVALTRLGYAQEQDGKAAEAQAAYASAADIEGPFAPEALLGAARTIEQAGNLATARELYEDFLNRYPTSDRRSLVTARLVALGGSVPAAEGDSDGSPGRPVVALPEPAAQ